MYFSLPQPRDAAIADARLDPDQDGELSRVEPSLRRRADPSYPLRYRQVRQAAGTRWGSGAREDSALSPVPSL
jgi:hypothetical protein